ncbi:MAG: Crp/Fnr family transcriptional regulator, partial [Flavobacteriales bacterium]|nr:Crp/Fnr family transcriptional regulator [Flavobacteriales bacterium]
RSSAKGLFILRKGKVKIVKEGFINKKSIIYIQKKGDFFGYRPILSEEAHPVSAIAMENCVVDFIPRDMFLKTVQMSPEFAYELLKVQSKEFNVWSNKLLFFTQYSVKERLAITLLYLNEVYRKEAQEGNSIISISRDDLSSYMGIAKETLVRMLRTFKDLNIIVTKGSKISILNERRLSEIITDIKKGPI